MVGHGHGITNPEIRHMQNSDSVKKEIEFYDGVLDKIKTPKG